MLRAPGARAGELARGGGGARAVTGGDFRASSPARRPPPAPRPPHSFPSHSLPLCPPPLAPGRTSHATTDSRDGGGAFH